MTAARTAIDTKSLFTRHLLDTLGRTPNIEEPGFNAVTGVAVHSGGETRALQATPYSPGSKTIMPGSDRVLRVPLDDALRQLRLLPRLPPLDAVPHAVTQRSAIRRFAAFERHRDADEL